VIDNLERLDSWAIVLELFMVCALALSLGPLARLAFGNWPGVLVLWFVVPVGLVLPLVIKRWKWAGGAVLASVLVLIGGFALRTSVVGMPFPLLALNH
jgi:hypothetical protein